MKELGRRIRSRRRMAGLTQVELAARVGRTHGWLSAIEAGRGGGTPAELLTALAVELGDDPALYLRLAGRAVLVAEDIIPVSDLDPRVAASIEAAVERAMDRFAERLEALLREIAAR